MDPVKKMFNGARREFKPIEDVNDLQNGLIAITPGKR